MKVIKLDQDRYGGFLPNLKKHVILRGDGDIMLLGEAKLIAPNGEIVVFCKEDGEVEFSYSTVKRFDSITLNNFKSELTEQPALSFS